MDYIEAWLPQLEYETRWIAQFDVDSCINVLERACPDYRGLHVNLYDLLFAHKSELDLSDPNLPWLHRQIHGHLASNRHMHPSLP